jgi:hypothetical protein
VCVEDFQERRNRSRAIAVSMLQPIKRPRRKRDRQVLQGPRPDCIGTDALGQNSGASAREDRGENCLIGREFDGDI